MWSGKWTGWLAALVVLMLALLPMRLVAQAGPGQPQPMTLEQFGGQAYYKRFDGQLTYTPHSADPAITAGTSLAGRDYTRITWEGEGQVFTADDLGKRFAGLFAHKNPGHVDPQHSDRYYPNIVGSRYASVVHVIDGRNILVDFEYNGGDESQPRVLHDAKGYVFFDNSDAWARLWQAFARADNPATEVRLREHSRQGMLQATYVIPQHRSASLPARAMKLWTGSASKARVKIGVEDYFKWDRHLGKPMYGQDVALFRPNPGDHDVVIHNIVFTPPHRAVREASTFVRSIFGQPATIGPCARILAVIGNTALDEQREIASADRLTEEHIRCAGVGWIYSGGKYAGEGVEQDVVDYQYILLKDFEHNGQGLIDLKANSGAGNYLVMENVSADYRHESDWQPPARLVEGRFTTDQAGLDPKLVHREGYPPEVFEITSGHSFQQVDNSFHIHGWGNRANIIQVDRFAFCLGNNGTWSEIYEKLFSESKEKFNWKLPVGAHGSHMRSGRKHMMVQRIPHAGQRYVIGRDYTVKPGGGFPRQVDELSPNAVRGFVNWSLVLGKQAKDITPADIPANAKPIQLQAGDQFRIVGRDDTLYTVLDNNRGPWSQFNTEFNGHEVYNYTRHTLDHELPADLPMAFEVDMVTSTSEVLLDGQVRPAWIIYKSNVGWRSTIDTKFGDPRILSSNPLGHLSYNHRQFAMWGRNVQHRGFYRQSGAKPGPTYSIIDPDTHQPVTVNRLGWQSPGYTLINSSGFMGEFSGGSPDFAARDKILRSLGRELPDAQRAKMRLYNCVDVRLPHGEGADRYYEIHETDADAPDMPAPCRKLLDSLPASSPAGVVKQEDF